jgi:hypothetical protein
MLAADPADRPAMPEVRDELAKLAAGRDGDTTTVLLARTDIRSGTPGRTRTASFPAGPPTPAAPAPETTGPPTPEPATTPAAAAGAAAGTGTASAVVDRPPVQPAPPAPPREKRGRGAWIAAAVVAVLLVGLAVFLLTDPFGGDGGSDAQESPTPSSSAAPSTTPEPSPTADASGDTGEEAGGETTTPPSDAEPAAADPAQAATALFSLIPDDLPAAHALTSPSFQSEFPLARFSGFWDDYQSVSISNVQAEDDTTALADITYVEPGGSTTTERHRLTFVRGEDGRLLLESDVIA